MAVLNADSCVTVTVYSVSVWLFLLQIPV
uniref:Uncharacterized protein n=1 Tax=Anguilla anguilla TaxID=7936 RepID=A0A0E9RVR2_ANGAN